MKIDKSILNTYTKQAVINIIRNQPGVYAAQIARMTGLSLPAIIKLIDHFVAGGIVEKTGKAEIKKGKPPETFRFVADAYYLIGIDVGTNHILVAFMDLNANILYRNSIPTPRDFSPHAVFQVINDEISAIYEQYKQPVQKLLGIGIGLAGIVDPKSLTVVFSPDFGWSNINLARYLKPEFLPMVTIENVTKAMALAEKWFGLAKDQDNMLCVNLGYGIGSAVLLDGEIYSGDRNAAGELGHIVMLENGPVCSCGNHGCLEALASANAMVKKANSLLGQYPDSLLHLVVSSGRDIEAIDIFEAAKNNDPLSSDLVNDAAKYIGMALANVANLMDLHFILFEGGVARAGDFYLDKINRSMQKYLIHYTGQNVQVKLSELGANSVVIGAATCILKKFIENGVVPFSP